MSASTKNSGYLAVAALMLICTFAPSTSTATDLAAIDDLEFMTEEFPPFNYTDGEQLKGMAVDILEETLRRVGCSKTRKDFMVYPWARGYQLAQTKGKFNVLFAMGRSSKREDLFKWLGPLTQSKLSIFALKGRRKVTNLKELEGKKIGVVRDDIGQVVLEERGFKESELVQVNRLDQLFAMTKLERIDYFVYGEEVSIYSMKNEGIDPNSFIVVHVLKELPQYYGVNKSVPDWALSKLQKGLDSVKADSDFMKQIRAKYNSISE